MIEDLETWIELHRRSREAGQIAHRERGFTRDVEVSGGDTGSECPEFYWSVSIPGLTGPGAARVARIIEDHRLTVCGSPEGRVRVLNPRDWKVMLLDRWTANTFRAGFELLKDVTGVESPLLGFFDRWLSLNRMYGYPEDEDDRPVTIGWPFKDA